MLLVRKGDLQNRIPIFMHYVFINLIHTNAASADFPHNFRYTVALNINKIKIICLRYDGKVLG